MKKAWKATGITAVCMFAVGLALVVAAMALGSGFSTLRGRIGVTDLSRDFSGETINSLDIQMSVGKLTVTPGAEFKVVARDIAQSGFVCEVRNGVLTIRDEWESTWALDITRGFSIGGYEPSIHVYLPDGFVAENADFTVAAGMMRVESLAADTAGFTVNAGEITVIDLSAGDVWLLCNTGAARLSGSVSERGGFTCNLGSVELELSGLLNDYDVSGSVGIGRLEVGGNTWNLSGSGRAGAPGGIPLELKVDVGEMELRFNG